MAKSKLTVNQILTLMVEVKTRLTDLKQLRTQVAIAERNLYGGTTGNIKEVTPQYDIKLADKKIMELQTFIFKADAAIKQSNASTTVDLEIDTDEILAPLA